MGATELNSLTSSLVGIESHSRTDRVLSFIERYFSRVGVRTWRKVMRGAGEVLCAGDWEDRTRPTILLATHADTVPESEGRSGVSEAGRRITGRGSLDMKGGVALSMILTSEFHRAGGANVLFCATSDEEAHSAGAWALVRDKRFRPALVLVPEPTWETVALSASGRRCWNLSFLGKSGHAEGLFGSRGNVASALVQVISQLPDGCTVLSLSTGGEGEVTVPSTASATVDQLFSVPGEGRASELRMRGLVERVLKDFQGVKCAMKLAERATPWPEPYRTSHSGSLVKRFEASVNAVLGSSKVVHENAVGDFNVYGSVAPTIIFGPKGDGAHGANEWVDKGSLAKCLDVYRNFLSKLSDR